MSKTFKIEPAFLITLSDDGAKETFLRSQSGCWWEQWGSCFEWAVADGKEEELEKRFRKRMGID